MKHLPLPTKFKNILDYLEPYRLRKNFKNYFIIVTQDYVLTSKQKRIRQGKGSRVTYKDFERKYIIKTYGINYGVLFDSYFKKTRENKF